MGGRIRSKAAETAENRQFRRANRLERIHAPASFSRARFRLTVFGKPREGAPWRATKDEVLLDAIRLGLASWDASQREHFLAVPVEIATDWQEPGERHPLADAQ